MSAPQRRALVLGGSGTVGREVVRQLAAAGVTTAFTFHSQKAFAEALAAETSSQAYPLDLLDGRALPALFATLRADGGAPDVLVHAAGVLEAALLHDLEPEAWERAYAINGRSALSVCREMAHDLPENAEAKAQRSDVGRDIVLLGGLDRGQSLPVPVAYAATQGMLGSLAMAVAKELGGRGVRINMVALGLLDAGLSLELAAKVREDYLAFSALRRFGSAAEVARGIVWLALHNSYLNGKVIPLNGGI